MDARPEVQVQPPKPKERKSPLLKICYTMFRMNSQNELESIPKGENRIKTAKQNLKLFFRSNSFIYVVTVAVLVICSFLLGTWHGKQKTSLVENVTTEDKNEVAKYNSPEESVKPTSIAIPPYYAALSAESAKTRTVFDLSTWKTYENTEIGLRFKYPSEWGEPKGELSICDNPELCSNDGKPTTTFLLKFPNSEFQIGGGSKNFAPHRGGNILGDYTGFSSTRYSPEKVCKIPWFIFCQQTDNKVDYVSTPACVGEPGSGFGYERVHLIDLPNKKVNGLAFGGKFIPKDLIYSFASCDEQIKKAVGDAIISRKLSTEIMKSFDTFEKVFESIEIY
jgi:hypothetical protein